MHPAGRHRSRSGVVPTRPRSSSETLDIYAHEFEEARGRDDIADKLSAAFAGLLTVESDRI